jgi:hypothetical protein
MEHTRVLWETKQEILAPWKSNKENKTGIKIRNLAAKATRDTISFSWERESGSDILVTNMNESQLLMNSQIFSILFVDLFLKKTNLGI